MPMAICEGVTVLQLGTGKAGSVATMILADHGARVLKIEPPEGDPLRAGYPAAFLTWNRGKESVAADLWSVEGRREVAALAAKSDVLVESLAAGTAQRYGLDARALRAANPRLVYCSIKGFGARGAYAQLPAYDAIVAAKSGRFQPAPFRAGPLYSNYWEGSLGAAHLAVQGILAALIVRERTGRGQEVGTSLYQGMTPYDLQGMITWHVQRRGSDLAPRGGAGSFSLGSDCLCTKDGRWVEFMSILPHQFRAYVKGLGMEHLWDDPRFATAPRFTDLETKEHFRDLFFARFRERTLAEWMPVLMAEKDLACDVVESFEQALEHPQVKHNRTAIEIHDPRVGPMRQVGPLAAYSASEPTVGRPAPELGQHGPLEWDVRDRERPATAPPAHPLDGVTILEFAAFYGSTFGCTLAAELGARVIKIEDLGGDPWRAGGLNAVKTLEGKESLALNVGVPEAQQILRKLVEKADVFVYGFRPATAPRLGVDYETLKQVNPRLVYLFAGGYGVTGPYAERPMYGNTTKAMMGGKYRQAGHWLDPLLTVGRGVAGLKELGQRMSMAGSVGGDPESALGRGSVLLLAIFDQLRTGRGQYIETSMVNLTAYGNSEDFNSYAGKPRMPLPDPDGFGLSALYRLYPASWGWVFLACPKQREFEALCAATALDQVANDPRFSSAVVRRAHDAELAGIIGELFARKTAAEWESELSPQGIGCVEVYEGSPADFACTDPVVRDTRLVGEVTHPRFGTHLRHGCGVTLSETPGRLEPGCEIGQHTAAILAELGYEGDAIRRLEEAKVVGIWRPEAVTA